MEQAFGNYLNVYGQGYDIFVIFNEGNDEPAIEELDIISNVVKESVEEGICDNDAFGTFRNELMRRIEATNLPCVEIGVQVILAL